MTKLIRTVPPLPATERGQFTRFSFDAAGDRVLYCNGNNIIWRHLAPLVEGKETPEDVFCYQCPHKTTCVSMSPNGQWVASGDVRGALKVWGAKGDHILKGEYPLMGGELKDVSWSGDSTRIVACGNGNETKAVAMIWDTGSKTGVVTGHTKMVNSIAFRSQRPFRIMTGSEDMQVMFHEGPPFKFSKSDSCHTNFVNWVGFSPDGEWGASAGSDSKLVLFGAKDGDLVKEFEKPKGITGTLWSAAWAPDSNRIVTAGGDKKIRIWDRESGKQAGEALVGAGALHDMQVGVCWTKENTVVSLCLDGRLLVWEVAADGSLSIVASIEGTQGALTALGHDDKTGTLVAGSSAGNLAIYPAGKPAKKVEIGKTVQHIICHSGAAAGPAEAWVIALDNCVRRVGLDNGEIIGTAVDIKETATGAGWLDETESKLLVASSKGSVHCVSDKSVEWSKAGLTKRAPTAFGIHPGSKAAFGIDKPDTMVNGVPSQQFDIQLFGIAGANSPDGIKEEAVLEGHNFEIACLRFSPNGEFLASSDAGKVIKIWCLKDVDLAKAGGGGYSAGAPPVAIAQMSFEYNAHNARVSTLAWLPDGRTLVSGSLDQNIMVYDIDVEGRKVKLKEALKKELKSTSCFAAHRGGVTAIAVTGDSGFASVGADGFLSLHSFA